MVCVCLAICIYFFFLDKLYFERLYLLNDVVIFREKFILKNASVNKLLIHYDVKVIILTKDQHL